MSNHMSSFFASALVATLSLLPLSSAGATELAFLTSWDEGNASTVNVAHAFADKVTAATQGRITFRLSGPEVVPPLQQLDPVSQGVFDIHHGSPSYVSGSTGVPFAFFALPANAERWRENGYWDFADREFARFNQKLIALVSETDAEDAFQIILNEPLGEGDTPLSGLKVRGNAFYAPVVETLGGSLVNLPAGEVYAALERGVVDGAGWPVAGAENMGFQEVSSYMMRPRFGTLPTYLTMNLDSYNALSEEDQELFLKLGREVEREVPEKTAMAIETTLQVMSDAGIQETVLTPELAATIELGFKAGLWATAAAANAQSAARVEELRNMARAAGDAE